MEEKIKIKIKSEVNGDKGCDDVKLIANEFFFKSKKRVGRTFILIIILCFLLALSQSTFLFRFILFSSLLWIAHLLKRIYTQLMALLTKVYSDDLRAGFKQNYDKKKKALKKLEELKYRILSEKKVSEKEIQRIIKQSFKED